jgi:hypothetical protein
MIDTVLLILQTLLITVIAGCAVLGELDKRNNKESAKERTKLINALVARNAYELQALEFNDKVRIPEEPELPSDLIPAENMDDKEFADHIQKMQELEDNA